MQTHFYIKNSILCITFFSYTIIICNFFIFRVKCITDALNDIRNQSSEDLKKVNRNIFDKDIQYLENENNLEKTEISNKANFNYYQKNEIFYYEVCGM